MRVDASKETALPVEEIIAKDPATALYLPFAERLVEDGRLEEAIALCENRKRRPGHGVGDHIVLGRAYLADGQLASARAEFQASLDLDRENVVALKALGGILAHEGNHAEAASYYQAVCRVDPGDLESQTALHQITSGEFPEIRPADVIVGQGGLTWQPVRLPREEEHLSELALGLRNIDRFDGAHGDWTVSSRATSAANASEVFDLPVERIAPIAPAAHEAFARITSAPIGSGAGLEESAEPARPMQAGNDDADDTVMLVASDLEVPGPPAATPDEQTFGSAPIETAPTALGDLVPHHPPVEVPRAPGKVVEGNKNAFETWLHHLSGKE